MVLAFWSIQIYNFIQIHLTYSDISHFFYLSYAFAVISLPLIIMLMCRIVLGFILVIYNNQDLIATIKRILEVFPEAIIIQSIDRDSDKLVMQFANDTANKDIIKYEESLGKPIQDESLSYVLKTSDKFTRTCQSFQASEKDCYTLSEVLQSHAYIAQINKFETTSSVEFCSKDQVGDNEDTIDQRFYDIKTVCVKWNDNENSFVHVFINTTTIKRFEMEKTRNEVLQMMFSSVSHEFRTPINAFTNSMLLIESIYQQFLDKLSESRFDGIRDELFTKHSEITSNRFFKICKISTTSLLSLVEDILDLAKIEAGTFKLNKQPFDVHTLIEEIKYIFEFQWTQKGITFKVNVNDDLMNSSFCSDTGRIKQVLINLISNACKFTFEGRITLNVFESHEFDQTSFERAKYLKFEVHDTGIGIDENEIPKLFKLFGTVSQNQTNVNSRGTGLGLAISKKIVESLGGSIYLKSMKSIGTKVTFTVKESHQTLNEIEQSNSHSFIPSMFIWYCFCILSIQIIVHYKI